GTNLARQFVWVASDLELVREEELRMLLGFLIVETVYLPVERPHDAHQRIDFVPDHREIWRHGDRRGARRRRDLLKGHSRRHIQARIDIDLVENDLVASWYRDRYHAV